MQWFSNGGPWIIWHQNHCRYHCVDHGSQRSRQLCRRQQHVNWSYLVRIMQRGGLLHCDWGSVTRGPYDTSIWNSSRWKLPTPPQLYTFQHRIFLWFHHKWARRWHCVADGYCSSKQTRLSLWNGTLSSWLPFEPIASFFIKSLSALPSHVLTIVTRLSRVAPQLKESCSKQVPRSRLRANCQ